MSKKADKAARLVAEARKRYAQMDRAVAKARRAVAEATAEAAPAPQPDPYPAYLAKLAAGGNVAAREQLAGLDAPVPGGTVRKGISEADRAVLEKTARESGRAARREYAGRLRKSSSAEARQLGEAEEARLDAEALAEHLRQEQLRKQGWSR